CESGIVQARKDGKWTHYSISAEGSAQAQKRLLKLTEAKSTVHGCK
ncbi:MAG: transcriptional regulator, partial [Hydrogenoanaerobacterium sp.]